MLEAEYEKEREKIEGKEDDRLKEERIQTLQTILQRAWRYQERGMLEEMHQLYRRGHTPKAKPGKGCSACSLKDLCLPRLARREPVAGYLDQAMEELP